MSRSTRCRTVWNTGSDTPLFSDLNTPPTAYPTRDVRIFPRPRCRRCGRPCSPGRSTGSGSCAGYRGWLMTGGGAGAAGVCPWASGRTARPEMARAASAAAKTAPRYKRLGSNVIEATPGKRRLYPADYDDRRRLLTRSRGQFRRTTTGLMRTARSACGITAAATMTARPPVVKSTSVASRTGSS